MPFKPGQSGNPAGKPKGTKNRDTLLKEERRRIFEERVSQDWEETIKKLRPEYVADQFMGKAPDKVEITGEIKTVNLPSEKIEAINELALNDQ